MAPITVRRLELTDLEDVLNILCQTWTTPDVVGPAILNRIRANPDYQYVAELDDRIVGFQTSYGIDLENGIGWIGYFATDIQHRRKGVASALVERFQRDARDAGINTLRTQTGAKAFFESLGFHVAEIWRPMAKGIDEYAANVPALKTRRGRLSDVGPVEAAFGRKQAEAFLEAQFQIFRDEPQRSVVSVRDGDLIGAVVGRTEPGRRGTVSVTYLAGIDESVKADLCDALARENVTFAVSDVTIQARDAALAEALEARGWRETGQHWVMEKHILRA